MAVTWCLSLWSPASNHCPLGPFLLTVFCLVLFLDIIFLELVGYNCKVIPEKGCLKRHISSSMPGNVYIQHFIIMLAGNVGCNFSSRFDSSLHCFSASHWCKWKISSWDSYGSVRPFPGILNSSPYFAIHSAEPLAESFHWDEHSSGSGEFRKKNDAFFPSFFFFTMATLCYCNFHI